MEFLSHSSGLDSRKFCHLITQIKKNKKIKKNDIKKLTHFYSESDKLYFTSHLFCVCFQIGEKKKKEKKKKNVYFVSLYVTYSSD